MRAANRLGWESSGSVSPAGLTSVPTWIKVGAAVTHTALKTAAVTNSITLFSLIAGGIIGGVKIKHSVAFAGTLISAYTLSVGIAGALDKYATAFDVFQAVGNSTFQLSAGLWSENNAAATTILLTAISTGANLSASTAGTVDIWALLSVAV